MRWNPIFPLIPPWVPPDILNGTFMKSVGQLTSKNLHGSFDSCLKIEKLLRLRLLEQFWLPDQLPPQPEQILIFRQKLKNRLNNWVKKYLKNCLNTQVLKYLNTWKLLENWKIEIKICSGGQAQVAWIALVARTALSSTKAIFQFLNKNQMNHGDFYLSTGQLIS